MHITISYVHVWIKLHLSMPNFMLDISTSIEQKSFGNASFIMMPRMNPPSIFKMNLWLEVAADTPFDLWKKEKNGFMGSVIERYGNLFGMNHFLNWWFIGVWLESQHLTFEMEIILYLLDIDSLDLFSWRLKHLFIYPSVASHCDAIGRSQYDLATSS